MQEINEKIEAEKKSKSRNKELLRSFRGEDSQFLEETQTICNLLAEQLANFTAIDPSIDATFQQQWQLQINQCHSITSDRLMLVAVEEKTREQQTLLTTCLQLTIDLEFYTKKAFPQTTALWDEFAFKQRTRISKSASGTVFWLHTMHRVAQDYETQLLAAGMPATLLADLEAQTNAMALAEREQEYAKRLRLRKTRERIMHLNRLHTYVQTVQRASRLVYRNDYARYHQFNP